MKGQKVNSGIVVWMILRSMMDAGMDSLRKSNDINDAGLGTVDLFWGFGYRMTGV